MAGPVSPVFRRLGAVQILESRRRVAGDGVETREHLVSAAGKYSQMVIGQEFGPGAAGAAGALRKEVAYVADALLVRATGTAPLDALVARGEIRSYRRLAKAAFRVTLPVGRLGAVEAARARLAQQAGISVAEPDYLVFTTDEPSPKQRLVDRDGDGVVDDEPLGAMAVESPEPVLASLGPEQILADVEQRLAAAPAGARVLTFDAPLSDLRSQVGYRPYCMEQNFLLMAAPSQDATVYPQLPYNSGYPSNGTIYVRSLSGDSGMKLRHKDGLPFALHQIDLSEYSTVYSVNAVSITGYRKNGTTVSQSFTLDRYIDGTGPGIDFQTFECNANFTDLDSVVFNNEGFMMDNLVVSVFGEETPLPPPPASPIVYDITWDGAPHTLDQVTAVTGPYAPSTLNFGAPKVRSQIGAMKGPALELKNTGDIYEQFTCCLGKNGKWYTVEFDMTLTGGSLALFFDRPSGFARIDFASNGTISGADYSSYGTPSGALSGTFTPAAVTRFRFEADVVAGTLKGFKNNVLFSTLAIATTTAVGDVIDARFNGTLSGTQTVGIDNLRITADPVGSTAPSGPLSLITPLQVAFPTIAAGGRVERSVRITNIGTANLQVSGVQVDSPDFSTDPAATLNLLPGQYANLTVAYTPRTGVSHTGHLLFTTNEATSPAKSVLLGGTATGVPALVLTPATLHVTMLTNDVGTEHFTIGNTGNGPLSWQFVTTPPANPPSAVTPNDAQFSSLWGMKSPTGSAGGIDAVRAWSMATDARAVRVGVIDTGVDHTHQDLQGNVFVNAGEIAGNGIDDDHNGFIDDVRGWNFYSDTASAMDDHGHGTHVSGTIGAAGQNSLGVAGVAWQATIVPIKFLSAGGFGYTSDGIAAVAYAETMGCRVVNASWGGGGYSQLLRDAIADFCTANDALFVASAGNSYLNLDVAPAYPASYDVSGIASVAATDSFDNLAAFSNYGVNAVTIAAPGVDILSCALGNGYRLASGTSMAAPHVSGSAALLFSYHSGLTQAECLQRLVRGTDFPPSLNGKVRGGGRLNVYSALSSSVLPWIRPGLWSGTVAAGDSSAVSLSLNTNGMAPGAYTAALALRTNDPAHPTVAISVELTVKPRDSFNVWSAQQFAVESMLFESSAAAKWAPTADPDGDGVANLVEFLSGTDPLRAGKPVTSTAVDPSFGRAFLFQTRADLGGTSYRVESATSLAAPNWSSSGVQVRLLSTDSGTGLSTWEAYRTGSGALPALFYRMVVNEP
jgi:subtilisin family serine protease